MGKNLDSLKKLIIKWVQAEIGEFDIWQIEIETNAVRLFYGFIERMLKFFLKKRMVALNLSQKLTIKQ